jgi:acyl transferase domain-containing protein/3-hydroxymyristoyl/3-hydroxydecanoyl-(acyl carrier protein) dehydratase
LEQHDPIAIVGIWGVFPGAPTPERLWANVHGGVDATGDVPPDRWPIDPCSALDSRVALPDHVYSLRGGFLSIEALEGRRLDVGQSLPDRLDPVFHLALHVARRAWQDARTDQLDPRRVGVVFGNIVLPTESASRLSQEVLGVSFLEQVGLFAPDSELEEPRNAFPAGLPAALVARALGLEGPAFTLDAACASSLYAVKLAIDALKSGETDAMLAGGVSRPDSLYTQMGFSQLRALSARGRAAPLDHQADGLVVGEGAGMFVLKRLQDALTHGDDIYGLVAGIGLSNDVEGDLLAPSSEGQLRAMRMAYEAAGWSPSDVDLIECHAAGTPRGDAVEVASLKELWSSGAYNVARSSATGEPPQSGGNVARRSATGEPPQSSGLPRTKDQGPRTNQCVIGSVKSNVGHALTAAGAAGLLKVLLALRERVLPPTANFVRPSPELRLEDSPFRVLTQPEPWPSRYPGTPRRAAISGFGFGGINAHVLIEEWLPSAAVPSPQHAKQARPRAKSPSRLHVPAPLAIVGLAAHFGPLAGARAFQEHLLGERRGDKPAAPRNSWGLPQTAWYRRHGWNDRSFPGYYLDELELPVDRFRIPPRELAETLPQQALSLQVAAQALLDARWEPSLASRTGVLFGIGLDLSTTNYHLRWTLPSRARHWDNMLGLGLDSEALARWAGALRDSAGPPLSANRTMGSLGGLIASRIARHFKIGGPSFTLSCDENSGIAALQIAHDWLRRGELDVVVVGAVDLAGDIRTLLAREKLQPRRSTEIGATRAGDPQPADDVPIACDGAVCLVLKRLDDAERHRNRVYAVLRGVTMISAQHGSACGMLDGLRAAAERLELAAGGDDVSSLGLLEIQSATWNDPSHHTAGRQPASAAGARGAEAPQCGDRQLSGCEGRVDDTSEQARCALGSVAVDLGHAGAAAGLASVAKAVLCLAQEVIPASAAPAEWLFEASSHSASLFVPQRPQLWPRNRAAGPRRAAAISSSLGGQQGFVFLEDSRTNEATATSPELCRGPRTKDQSSPSLRDGDAQSSPSLRDGDSAAERRPTLDSAAERRPTLDQEPNSSIRIEVRGKAFQVPPIPAARKAATSGPPVTSSAGGASPAEQSTLAQHFDQAHQATAEAHRAFLRVRQDLADLIGRQIAWQLELTGAVKDRLPAHGGAAIEMAVACLPPTSAAACVLDRDRCLEFATGSIAAVLGPDFAPVDRFPTRVRLPAEPLMLVDRILTIEGKALALKAGRVVTVHVIEDGAWYLDDNAIPASIAIEAGQADLFLSAYLGVDLETRGLAVYRLLDATVTFHRALPSPPEVIRYDIRITSFFRQGKTVLFRFQFDATVAGAPFLTMRDGCAGFFTPEELATGKGIVTTSLEGRSHPAARSGEVTSLVPLSKARLGERELDALRRADLAGAFGTPFERLAGHDVVPLPGGRMALLHAVPELDPLGGPFGLGLIRAEAVIHPDDWFMVCHFVDDRVMPGTLVYECCLHALRVLLMRMGWIARRGRTSFEPVPGIPNRLKCRGQIVESTGLVTFEVSIKELGYLPEPYALADALVFAGGRPIVEIAGISLQLSGSSQRDLEQIWPQSSPSLRDGDAESSPSLRDRDPESSPSLRDGGTDTSPSLRDPGGPGPPARRPTLGAAAERRPTMDAAAERRPTLPQAPGPKAHVDHERLLAFAVGKPSAAFGEPYRAFDEDRFLARLPGPPYLFLHRITRVAAESWIMAAGGSAEAEYDVAPDAWFFAADRQERMPFAVLLEIALQACGWLAAYMGSALTSTEDLKFRNLGGTARQHRAVRRDAGTLTARTKATKIAATPGMILQQYEFSIHSRAGLVYDGATEFGFFAPRLLHEQVGIRDAAPYASGSEERASAKSFSFPTEAPFPDPRWRMVEQIDELSLEGGPCGLGLVRGSSAVDPGAWFFAAHFLHDPVWPGSLGLESVLQLLKVAATMQFGTGHESVFESPALGQTHRWTYRGQIIPGNRRVTVQAEITARDDQERSLRADGYLGVDDKIIYKLNDFSIRLCDE